jgi:uncharacterized membrane protein YfcA
MTMTVSPKVSAASTASAAAALVVSTVAAHVFHGTVPADVLRLCEAGLTAVATFAAGWFAKHVPQEVVAVASTLVADAEQEATRNTEPEPVSEAVTPAPIVVPPVGG